ncbi:TonB-dependent receptor [Caulobacter segnis]|uniref:TonB-dependent receptor n=1 Tax=Caulobacter segnis TaxID=88688 RepID=A0A2W5X8M5_9CAUL|nr:TonB-dependent receptor [Caulobacter segnis]PZR37444.1 MAG: TonB-dependent receptor [Caulobacter segnis]
MNFESVSGCNRGNLHLITPIILASVLGLGSVAQAQETKSPETKNEVESVVVTGKRVSEAAIAVGTDQATATVSITREALLSAPAGITGLKMLESLPGFNVQANDALGMYEFGNSVTVRAFNFQQVGFLLDDIPMGRSDQFGGSPIYRYVDNENLLRVTASSGAGDVSLPSYASLGPIVDYFTQQPGETAGGKVSQTFGEDNLTRTFLRLETGEHKGFSAYASGSVINSDQWRGPGTIDREHYEGKIRWDFGSGDLTFQTVHNDYFDYDSPSFTIAQYKGTANDVYGRKGRDFGYVGYIANLPPTSSGLKYSNANYAQYYKFGLNARTDHLYGVTLHKDLAENLRFTGTVYYEKKDGWGSSGVGYDTALTYYNQQKAVVPGLNAPLGLQFGISQIDGIRKGATGKVTWTLGDHKVEGGAWYEDDDYHQLSNTFNVADGSPEGAPNFSQPVYRTRNYTSKRDTWEGFLKDTVVLADGKLKVDAGFRMLSVDYQMLGKRNREDFRFSQTANLRTTWEDLFLPQVGAVYTIGRGQVFTSYSENMSLPRGADAVYYTPATVNVPAPKAETSKNIELGYRANHPTFNASVVTYYTSFQNRLQSFSEYLPGTTTLETYYQNVGGVHAYGLEFSGQWKPEALGGKIYFNTNASYNKSVFEDGFSIRSATGVTDYPLKGKSVPDFPEIAIQGGVTFEPTEWAVINLSARHISDRYSNFMNNEKTKGYTLFNMYVDLGEGFDYGPLKDIKVRINVDNIFDKDYLGTISTVVTGAANYRSGPHRTAQITLSTNF